ncbi:hypothetical protein [Pseudomonas laurylsulfatiphila]|uniref:hypothetical protein n=1 Tax=Pseudomonas laurylsulfatiphila TaxID=2011015 RepID=UPI003D1C59B1|nr:hypothetical protein [Pseudomonas reinekei]
MEEIQTMQDPAKQQSFTAKLFVGGKPVAEVRKVIYKLLEDPEIGSEWHEHHENILNDDPQYLSYREGVIPEIFLFTYHDDVYTIRIKGEDGQFTRTASMEGSPRNLSMFTGDDPTYFRIVNSDGVVVKLDEIPDDVSEVYLETGPQRRPVHTYAGPPTFPVFTDDQNRGGSLVSFRLQIIERNVPGIR